MQIFCYNIIVFFNSLNFCDTFFIAFYNALIFKAAKGV